MSARDEVNWHNIAEAAYDKYKAWLHEAGHPRSDFRDLPELERLAWETAVVEAVALYVGAALA